MKDLLPDELKTLWSTSVAGGVERQMEEQERLMNEYVQTWTNALILSDQTRLEDSLLLELRRLLPSMNEAEVERRWRCETDGVAEEWLSQGVNPNDREAVESFYDQSVAYLFELMQWHTLNDDNGPLAYVVALRLAEQHGCREYLDFGSGVGSGALLFARHGFNVTLSDISSSMLDFARARFSLRGIPATFVDLKREQLPRERYDMVTAMDVWEHLVDPVEAAHQIAGALRPGGFLFGRFAAEPDDKVPQHILFDFHSTFRQFERDGLECVWKDEWLWGHQAFQKR